MLEPQKIIGVKHDLEESIAQVLKLRDISNCISDDHVSKTPERFTEALFELMEGCFEDPKECLSAAFPSDGYNEIVYVNSVSFISICAHHLLCFLGKAHFGYLPDKKIVGLSKIPRLIKSYAKRPQLQEKLTMEIVDTFDEIIQPKGCGLVMEAYHLCMSVRGVQDEQAWTKTTALKGCFQSSTTKEEFLQGIKQVTPQVWP